MLVACPAIGARIVSPTVLRKVAPLYLRHPDDDFAAGPDYRVKARAEGAPVVLRGCPSVDATWLLALVSATLVRSISRRCLKRGTNSTPHDHLTIRPDCRVSGPGQPACWLCL